LKLAVAQTFVLSDISNNGIAIRAMIKCAAEEGARLVSFCEGALSGYAKSQILNQDAWHSFDWASQEAELRGIAILCGELRVFAVVGAAHRFSEELPPHNSLYVFSDKGELITRYDKRFLSNAELKGWYSPGSIPITFEVENYLFGCAVCIEVQFPEVFIEYEQLNVDAILFSSFGIPKFFQTALEAHAGLNGIWIAAATPAQTASDGSAGIIGPDGKWIARCLAVNEPSLVFADLDKNSTAYDVALNKARPWRKTARQGDIYREKLTNLAKSKDRKSF
jgi:deaminated glutathione amidase